MGKTSTNDIMLADISRELEKNIHFKNPWITEEILDEIISMGASGMWDEFKTFDLRTILSWFSKYKFRRKPDEPINPHDSEFHHIFEFFGSEVVKLEENCVRDFKSGKLSSSAMCPYELYWFYVEQGRIKPIEGAINKNYKFSQLTPEIKAILHQMQAAIWNELILAHSHHSARVIG